MVKEQRLTGSIVDSRYTKSHLFLVFRDQLPMINPAASYGYSSDPVPDAPVAIDQAGTSVAGTTCTAITKPTVPDVDFRLTKVAVFNAKKPAEAPQLIAAVGGGDQMYMTADTVYLAKQGRQWLPWSSDSAYNTDSSSAYEDLVITKLTLRDDDTLAATAIGSVRGHVKDQWSFNEYADQGVLAVATTTGQVGGDPGTAGDALNHLSVLKQDGETLKLAAPVLDFAPGEDIRSMRYVDNIAYAVTFKRTDPLFAFDLSTVTAPKLLGELQMQGFSTYMHPVSDRINLGREDGDVRCRS